MQQVRAFAVAAFVASSAPSLGAYIDYFGEDLNPGGTVPAAGSAMAARDAFLSTLPSGVGTETFESLAGSTPLSLSFPGSSGSITANLSGDAEILSGFGAGRFATSGSKWLEVGTNSSFLIEFSSPVSAFGFYGTDIGDFGGQIMLTLTNGVTKDITVNNTVGAPDGSLLFWGFTDDMNSYSKIEFNNVSNQDFWGFDDMTIGDLTQVQTGSGSGSRQGVPDGGSTLVMLGSAVVGLWRLKKHIH
jgi:hypothetical protein